MRVSRITGVPAPCSSCHNRAIIEVTTDHPNIRLCARCAKYLQDFIGRRLAEHLAGTPIPTPRGARPDNWGNR